jgi:hypothetical protein
MLTETCPWCGSLITHAKAQEIEERIRADEKKKAAAMEAALRKHLEEKHRQELEALRLAEQKKMSEELDRRMKAAQAQAEASRLKELADQRAALEKDRDQLLLKKQGEFNRQLEGVQKKAMELERKLQRKSAGEIGDGAEIDLYETLRAAFPEDQITRVDKGQAGADIIQDVRHKGEVCGRIIFDSKNRQGWQDQYVTKLREYKAAANADHAILCTTVFGKEAKELDIEDNIIVVTPARAHHIVDLLRRWLIALYMKGLSITDRAGKMQRLYEYITSDRYAQSLAEACRLTEEILELDVKEQNAHRLVWRDRGVLTKRLGGMLQDLDTEVASIVEKPGNSRTSAA